MTARAAVCAVRPRTETGQAAPADRRFASPFGWGGETTASSSAAVGTMGSTLEILIQRLWEGLWAGGAPCPLCSGQLRLDDGRGVCQSCGSALF
jgi:hypothetical protein